MTWQTFALVGAILSASPDPNVRIAGGLVLGAALGQWIASWLV